jgi:RNA polymerase subunit RPABC4/transcription elongation factor Spt4
MSEESKTCPHCGNSLNAKKISRFTPDLSFIENDEWKSIYKEWVDNKKSPFKKQIGVKKGFSELWKISGGHLPTAQEIINKSLANNWSGLFPIVNKIESKPDQETDSRSSYARLHEKYGR